MLLANLAKREYVDLRRVSDYLFQKIFLALLWGGNLDHPQFGRWAGDQVVVVVDLDICCYKATSLMREGKLNLPAPIFETLREHRGWDSLSQLVLREFKDITEELVDSLGPADRKGISALKTVLDLILEHRDLLPHRGLPPSTRATPSPEA